MARDHAQIFTRIWADDDFRALPGDAQRLYLLLVTQNDLTYAGALDLRISRWARCAPDTKPADIWTALDMLEERGFVVLDEGTEELLVRSYLRVNEVWKQPKLLTLALRQAGSIQSRRLRHALRVELLRLPDDKRTQEAKAFAATLPETPGDTPPDTPGVTPVDTRPDSPTDTHGGIHADTHGAGAAGTPAGTPTRTRGRGRNQEPGTCNQEPTSAVETSGGDVQKVNARDPSAPLPDHPPLCPAHAGWDRDTVPPCHGCGRLREQWETARAEAERPPPRPPWCGQCDEPTRLVETDDGMARCPDCHPLTHRESA